MSLFKILNKQTLSSIELSDFIRDNIHEIERIANLKYLDIVKHKSDIERFIHLQILIIENLNFSLIHNKAFIVILIEVCERLGMRSSISIIYNIYEKNKINIGSRLESILLYLYNVNINEDFINRFNTICSLIENSINTEEDKVNKPLASFVNYYSYVIYNTQPHTTFANSLRQKILDARNENSYYFLKNRIISEVLAIPLNDLNKANESFNNIIDRLLDKTINEIEFTEIDSLIELNTEYANKLSKIEIEIYQIRKLSIDLYKGSDDIFYSLGRGVTILSEEQQLFAYLNSYGNMHFAKCNYAYDNLPSDFFNDNIEIVDWGCGQALASMAYLDFIKKNNINQTIEKITLNEPSKIALRRGALHIKTFDNKIELQTIHKDLNSLQMADFTTNECVKLHLFSNILDIDNYSTNQLADLIKGKFKGLNYIVIVSPKITDLKTNRIDSFVKEFEKEDFNLIETENKNAGEWKGDWTMVFRLFKVKIK